MVGARARLATSALHVPSAAQNAEKRTPGFGARAAGFAPPRIGSPASGRSARAVVEIAERRPATGLPGLASSWRLAPRRGRGLQ